MAWTSYFNYDTPDGQHNLFDLFEGSFRRSLATFRTVHFGVSRLAH